jgi:hypothetical protein
MAMDLKSEQSLPEILNITDHAKAMCPENGISLAPL